MCKAFMRKNAESKKSHHYSTMYLSLSLLLAKSSSLSSELIDDRQVTSDHMRPYRSCAASRIPISSSVRCTSTSSSSSESLNTFHSQPLLYFIMLSLII